MAHSLLISMLLSLKSLLPGPRAHGQRRNQCDIQYLSSNNRNGKVAATESFFDMRSWTFKFSNTGAMVPICNGESCEAFDQSYIVADQAIGLSIQIHKALLLVGE
jgi:hypothetical protein